jgi:fatty acid/phospholipid biosynthesis enzyme
MADIMNKKGIIKNDDTSTKQISKEQKAEMRKLVKEIKEGKINITD